jgi:hypothetical protein
MSCSQNIAIYPNCIEQGRASPHRTTKILRGDCANRVKEECHCIGELVKPPRIMRGKRRPLTPLMDGLSRNREDSSQLGYGNTGRRPDELQLLLAWVRANYIPLVDY